MTVNSVHEFRPENPLFIQQFVASVNKSSSLSSNDE